MYCFAFPCLLQVRERLRSAQERNVMLEDELMLANQEVRVCTYVRMQTYIHTARFVL